MTREGLRGNFAHKWSGPWEILTVRGDSVYEVGKAGGAVLLNIDDLRLAPPRRAERNRNIVPEGGPHPPPPGAPKEPRSGRRQPGVPETAGEAEPSEQEVVPGAVLFQEGDRDDLRRSMGEQPPPEERSPGPVFQLPDVNEPRSMFETRVDAGEVDAPQEGPSERVAKVVPAPKGHREITASWERRQRSKRRVRKTPTRRPSPERAQINELIHWKPYVRRDIQEEPPPVETRAGAPGPSELQDLGKLSVEDSARSGARSEAPSVDRVKKTN